MTVLKPSAKVFVFSRNYLISRIIATGLLLVFLLYLSSSYWNADEPSWLRLISRSLAILSCWAFFVRMLLHRWVLIDGNSKIIIYSEGWLWPKSKWIKFECISHLVIRGGFDKGTWDIALYDETSYTTLSLVEGSDTVATESLIQDLIKNIGCSVVKETDKFGRAKKRIELVEPYTDNFFENNY